MKLGVGPTGRSLSVLGVACGKKPSGILRQERMVAWCHLDEFSLLICSRLLQYKFCQIVILLSNCLARIRITHFDSLELIKYYTVIHWQILI